MPSKEDSVQYFVLIDHIELKKFVYWTIHILAQEGPIVSTQDLQLSSANRFRAALDYVRAHRYRHRGNRHFFLNNVLLQSSLCSNGCGTDLVMNMTVVVGLIVGPLFWAR